MAKAKHCISCGKRGVYWPSYNPEACTQKCAANAFLSYADTGAFEAAYCPGCGGFGDPLKHKEGCDIWRQEDIEEDEFYGREEGGE